MEQPTADVAGPFPLARSLGQSNTVTADGALGPKETKFER